MATAEARKLYNFSQQMQQHKDDLIEKNQFLGQNLYLDHRCKKRSRKNKKRKKCGKNKKNV